MAGIVKEDTYRVMVQFSTILMLIVASIQIYNFYEMRKDRKEEKRIKELESKVVS